MSFKFTNSYIIIFFAKVLMKAVVTNPYSFLATESVHDHVVSVHGVW